MGDTGKYSNLKYFCDDCHHSLFLAILLASSIKKALCVCFFNRLIGANKSFSQARESKVHIFSAVR